MKTTWTCKKCGPVDYALHGDDAKYHCSSLDCDRVVEILQPDDRPKKRDLRRETWRKAELGKKALAESRLRASSSETSSAEGKRVLRAMEERNRLRKKGRTRPKLASKGEEKIVGKKKTSSRHGKCAGCKQVKWLLRKGPAACARCYHGEAPAPRKRKRKKKQETTTSPPPLPQEPSPPAEGNGSDLAAEVAAIESCASAIDALDPRAIRRVLSFVVVRHAETHGLEAREVYPLALPSPEQD